MKKINLEEWIDKYKPIFVEEELKDFDLFREELKQYPNNYIWTEISCEYEEFYIVTGIHIIDKFRIFVTEIPWEFEDIEVEDNEQISIEQAIKEGLKFAKEIGFLLDVTTLTKWYMNQFDKIEFISIGRAKYHLIDYFNEELEIEFTSEQEDKLHDYYSQL
jgi:hypothetical protein